VSCGNLYFLFPREQINGGEISEEFGTYAGIEKLIEVFGEGRRWNEEYATWKIFRSKDIKMDLI
jgi:hypothetical protein